jgi:hypothetical protein
MTPEEKLREVIRTHITQQFNEISTTGNVAGYSTPYAFTGDARDNERAIQKMARSIGYTLTNKGKKDIRDRDSLTENYYTEYKNDKSALPHQKIGRAISEINKQIKMVERVLHFNSRLKNEYGISNDKLWKRTQNQMTKLEGKLLEIAHRLRELRG